MSSESVSPLFARIRDALAPAYEVDGEIGHGGTSLVFSARDVALDRPVAIKVVRPELATARMIERFTREARLLANLNHPRIVPVYTAGQADGLFFYIMPYVQGEVLADRLKRGPLSAREATAVGMDILDALSSAHRAGVVHRDVSARNVFLAGGRALVTDFGIAKRVGEAADTAGTIGAMPPEQAAGGEPSPAADVYAVGALLYNAVTGRQWRMTATEDAAVWSGVPHRLTRVLRRALQWAPENRYADAGEFLNELKRSTRPPALWVGLVIAALLLVAFITRPWNRPAAVGASDLAMLPFDVSSATDPMLGHNVANLVGYSLAGVPELKLAPVPYTFRWYEAERKKSAAPNYSALDAKYYVTGLIVRRGDSLDARISVFERDGRPHATISVAGSASALLPLSDSIALQLLRMVHRRLADRLGDAAPVGTRSMPALRDFLDGDIAFKRGAWRDADKHFRAAVAHDSTFLLAWWRLLNTWRWMPTVVPDPQLDLAGLYNRYGATLGELDRRLIEAQLMPPSVDRLAKLEEAAKRFPRDGYAALLYGDELMHRGPFFGYPLSRALVVLEQAASLDPFLAPAYEHIAWLAIRLGEKERAARALQRLKEIAAPPEAVDLYTAALFEQAYIARFEIAQAAQRLGAFFDPGKPGAMDILRLSGRAGLLVGLPHTQLMLSELLLRVPQATASARAGAHQAIALASFTLGQSAAGLVHVDSAAALFGTPEARLETAQWRVLGAALGWPGIPAEETAAGRAQLARFAQQPPVAERAQWALLVDLIARRSTEATAAIERYRKLHNSATANQLAQMLSVLQVGAAGAHQRALTLSGTLLRYDAHGDLGDPFARAVLHVQRARWRQALGDLTGAESEYVWAENQDLVGWPSGSAQAAEVDWTFTIYGLLHRAALARERGDVAGACTLLREADAIALGVPLPELPSAPINRHGCAA